MKTIKANKKAIKIACEIIKSGGIIIFPTETVYGIGASALNKSAIKKIYKIKGRSFDKPLQVLISDKKQIAEFAKEISTSAQELIKKYWPGSLTLVLKKRGSRNNTVGLRMPDHKFILKLIKETGPLAATSANISGKPAPINAKEVNITADLLIDGGKCKQGLASTVIDATAEKLIVLRNGSIKI
ncbi:MAG: tRNA threonylcarbamoyladenosine biosynthesis protein [Candidatus Saganbacteria bacterium]|uniref:L-threonylcarbamoyladenylate synthase n=1 Tax=Candidatus Saganbacteria bacterium TaxID=2575572 RepID=A0A833P2R9_UNCSA|nr:MAG: tRNA threonylcarbamoyladenosine biosynthesis protein [Candidatus Saganbacteria bacterium]